jgi:hypothetical protein
MAIIIIDERPHRGVTILAGNCVIHDDELTEKTLAHAEQLDKLSTERGDRDDQDARPA